MEGKLKVNVKKKQPFESNKETQERRIECFNISKTESEKCCNGKGCTEHQNQKEQPQDISKAKKRRLRKQRKQSPKDPHTASDCLDKKDIKTLENDKSILEKCTTVEPCVENKLCLDGIVVRGEESRAIDAVSRDGNSDLKHYNDKSVNCEKNNCIISKGVLDKRTMLKNQDIKSESGEQEKLKEDVIAQREAKKRAKAAKKNKKVEDKSISESLSKVEQNLEKESVQRTTNEEVKTADELIKKSESNIKPKSPQKKKNTQKVDKKSINVTDNPKTAKQKDEPKVNEIVSSLKLIDLSAEYERQTAKESDELGSDVTDHVSFSTDGPEPVTGPITEKTDKSRERIKAEREMKKKEKAMKKEEKVVGKGDSKTIQSQGVTDLAEAGVRSLLEFGMDKTFTVAATSPKVVENLTIKKDIESMMNVAIDNIEHITLSTGNMKRSEIPEEQGKVKINKSREEVLAEREMRKKEKYSSKKEGKGTDTGQADVPSKGPEERIQAALPEDGIEAKPKEKSKAELRAERRAIQEAQRKAKEAEKQQKTSGQQKTEDQKKPEDVTKLKQQPVLKEKKTVISSKPNKNRLKLFGHLQYRNPPVDPKLKLDVHPAIVALGAKYAARVINGSNARCLAFLQAIQEMIDDYSTPPEKEFSRGLEAQIVPAVSYLKKFRPLSVSITNALKHITSHVTQLPNNVSDDEARRKLHDVIDAYIRDQIHVAALAISKTMQRKIFNGDVILTFACSSLLCQLLIESKKKGTDFSVIIVDAEPWFEGREMLRRLTENNISCTYVLINALSFIMRKVTTVLIGAHALLANGYVMSRAGSSLVALMAHSYNVPVLVCCETHKFSERVQTDAFVYNELGDPDDIVNKGSGLSEWRCYDSLSPLNLLYDITPPDLVTAVVTELAILPCTSVPVVIRVKPSDLPT